MAMPFVATVSVIANQEWVVIIVPVHYVNEIVMGMVLVNTKACVIAKTDGAANIVIKKRVQNSAMPWTVVLLLVFVKATVANVYQVCRICTFVCLFVCLFVVVCCCCLLLDLTPFSLFPLLM